MPQVLPRAAGARRRRAHQARVRRLLGARDGGQLQRLAALRPGQGARRLEAGGDEGEPAQAQLLRLRIREVLRVPGEGRDGPQDGRHQLPLGRDALCARPRRPRHRHIQHHVQGRGRHHTRQGVHAGVLRDAAQVSASAAGALQPQASACRAQRHGRACGRQPRLHHLCAHAAPHCQEFAREHHKHDQHVAQLLALSPQVLQGLHASAHEGQDQRLPQGAQPRQARAQEQAARGAKELLVSDDYAIISLLHMPFWLCCFVLIILLFVLFQKWQNDSTNVIEVAHR